MIDSHAHLGLCEAGEDELIAAAREAGVRRILTVGLGPESNPGAVALARAHEEVFAAVGRHPNSAGEFGEGEADELESLAGDDGVVAIGETGLDYFRDRAEPEQQQRAFLSQIGIANRTGKPLVIHLRDRTGGASEVAEEAFATLSAEAQTDVILHCYTAGPAWIEPAAERGWYCSFAGNLTYPKADDLREAASLVPEDRLLVETDSPYPGPAAGAGQAEPARKRHRDRGVAGGGAGRHLRRARADGGGQRRPRLRVVAKPTPGRRQRRLGQNFLADRNLLEAIVRDADLGSSDVVLEVGGGGGALTELLAPAAAAVYVVELDERLRPELEPLAAEAGNVRLIWGDAMKVDLAALDPAPTTMVANLPYSVATPLLLRTIAELPSVSSWLVMVQREIADRLRASPGTKAYGSPSVLAQHAAEVELVRTIDPAVFTPRPRVESALLRLTRTGPAASSALRELVRAAFAHRRKSLARSLELARPGSLDRARDALEALGLPADARAEALSPAQFEALERELGW